MTGRNVLLRAGFGTKWHGQSRQQAHDRASPIQVLLADWCDAAASLSARIVRLAVSQPLAGIILPALPHGYNSVVTAIVATWMFLQDAGARQLTQRRFLDLVSDRTCAHS
jgi:hypothetical protein